MSETKYRNQDLSNKQSDLLEDNYQQDLKTNTNTTLTPTSILSEVEQSTSKQATSDCVEKKIDVNFENSDKSNEEEEKNNNDLSVKVEQEQEIENSADVSQATGNNKHIWHKLKTFLKSKRRRSSSKQAAASSFVHHHHRNHDQKSSEYISRTESQKRVHTIVTINQSQHSTNNGKDLKKVADVDCGYAWIILVVMFVINASTFGTARAYGLIFEKIARQDEQGRTLAALPFTIMGAVENMGGPITGYLLARTSWRTTVFVGSCLITLSHLLASMEDSIVNRTLAMGLMCGLGCSFITISSFQINNAYFDRYRSRAFGIGLTGAAVGTFYISPLCQYVLDNYTTNVCYLVLGFILFPNVLLSLLLKPKKPSNGAQNQTNLSITSASAATSTGATQTNAIAAVVSNSNNNNNKDNNNIKMKKENEAHRIKLWKSIKLVLGTPLFHLIWPTQLLFCWFNFVFGMIIVDFGKDRNLCNEKGSRLILFWAFGQLAGRLILGYLVDKKLFSTKTFTIICFLFISLATWILNNIQTDTYNYLIISTMVFILAMFISTIYILFNNLIVEYMNESLNALSVGISSFTGSFFLLPRANIIGYYRDVDGNYDSMLTLFTYVSLSAAIAWILIPLLIDKIEQIYFKSLERRLVGSSGGGGGSEQADCVSNSKINITTSSSNLKVHSSTTYIPNEHFPELEDYDENIMKKTNKNG